MIGSLFVGPSLCPTDRSGLNDFDLNPPAASGDLLRLVRRGVRAIGLIDGVFESTPSVWHKEILVALSEGVTVYGAASIGALRAAECDQFGMIGVGRIFEEYRDEARLADADVALLHGPRELGSPPLTLPLVDVEFLLRRLMQNAVIETAEADEILASARRLHFKSRTWNAVMANTVGIRSDRMEQLCAMAEALNFSQKRQDALELIELMRDHSVTAPPVMERYKLSCTGFLAALEGRIAK